MSDWTRQNVPWKSRPGKFAGGRDSKFNSGTYTGRDQKLGKVHQADNKGNPMVGGKTKQFDNMWNKIQGGEDR